MMKLVSHAPVDAAADQVPCLTAVPLSIDLSKKPSRFKTTFALDLF